MPPTPAHRGSRKEAAQLSLPLGANAAPDGSGADFAERVVRWQALHGRNHLPWQQTRDPYRVWLSEVMLQQTQVATVIGYFERFTARFPTVGDLAQASDDEVLGLWSGLGYYSRARNLLRCAREVALRWGGVFPASATELETLPGIGRSTAAAIASICHGERVAILDGNVKRVVARVRAFEGDLTSAPVMKSLWDEAGLLLPDKPAPEAMRRYTQGMMDLGATVCLPRRPDCVRCPVRDLCRAHAQGLPEGFPVRTRRLRRSTQIVWLLWFTDPASGAVWLERRPPEGVWSGLHCLPCFDDRDALLAALPAADRAGVQELPVVKHVLTHKDLFLHPVQLAWRRASTPKLPGNWVGREAWPALGLPAPIRRLLAEADACSGLQPAE